MLFARLLKNNNYLLWASPGQRPDVGSNDTLYAFECDELSNPDACFPTASRQYCISFDISHLPLTGQPPRDLSNAHSHLSSASPAPQPNGVRQHCGSSPLCSVALRRCSQGGHGVGAAIVHAKEIDDSAGVSASAVGEELAETLSRRAASGSIPLPAALVDETTFCLEPFKIVAYMGENWVKDAMLNANPHADSLQVAAPLCSPPATRPPLARGARGLCEEEPWPV